MFNAFWNIDIALGGEMTQAMLNRNSSHLENPDVARLVGWIR